jgi:anti-sigma-K factor RskA
MPEAHIIDDLPAYALGALEADERKSVDAHMAGCAACREAATEYRKLTAKLHDGIRLERPPSGTWDAIALHLPVDRPTPLRAAESASAPISFSRGPRLRAFVIGWAATAAALVALMAWVVVDSTREPSNPSVAELASAGDTSVVPLSGNTSGASGRFYVSAEHSLGGLAVTGLPSSATGQTYQVWYIGKDQQWTWGGSVQVNANGDGVAKLKLPGSLANFAGVAICTEPSSDSTTQWGQMVLSGPVYE